MRVVVATAGIFLLLGLGAGVGLTMAVTQERPGLPPVVKGLEPQPYVLPLEYATTVIYYCDETGARVWMSSRLIKYESGWNPNYRSKPNRDGTIDEGLGALNSRNTDYSTAWGKEFARRFNDGKPINPYDPVENIRVSIRYFASLRAEYGTWREAVRRYAGNRSAHGVRWIMGE